MVWAMNGKPLENDPRRPAAPGHPGLAGLGLAQVADADLAARQGARRPGHDAARPIASPSSRWCRAARPTTPTSRSWNRCRCASIITNPANGTKLAAGTKELKLRGAAWAGDHDGQARRRVDRFRRHLAARLRSAQPKNRYDWQRWTATRQLAERRLLRGVGARDRQRGISAAACRRQLEPAGLRRQSRCTASPSWSAERWTGAALRRNGWRVPLRSPRSLRVACWPRRTARRRRKRVRPPEEEPEQYPDGTQPRRHLLLLHRLPQLQDRRGARHVARALGREPHLDGQRHKHAGRAGRGSREDPRLSHYGLSGAACAWRVEVAVRASIICARSARQRRNARLACR